MIWQGVMGSGSARSGLSGSRRLDARGGGACLCDVSFVYLPFHAISSAVHFRGLNGPVEHGYQGLVITCWAAGDTISGGITGYCWSSARRNRGSSTKYYGACYPWSGTRGLRQEPSWDPQGSANM